MGAEPAITAVEITVPNATVVLSTEAGDADLGQGSELELCVPCRTALVGHDWTTLNTRKRQTTIRRNRKTEEVPDNEDRNV